MRKTLTALTAAVALVLTPTVAGAASGPAPADVDGSSPSQGEPIPGVPTAESADAEWRAWAQAVTNDARLRADDPSPGCTVVESSVELVVDADANAQIGAPADLAMPVVRAVEDCGDEAAEAAAKPARGIDAAPQARLASGNRCAYVSGGKICISDSGSTIRGTYTASSSTRGFVRLYQISPSASGCPTGSTRATSSERSLSAGQTLSTWFYQTQNSGYNATFWRDVTWGHTKAGSVCALL
ncbi:hypothetical protein SAMN04489860_0683 [Paraoerskovia marina]|uniref:Secreted protein n=1 Tax=Paraoerskovia marina TaxID=545619 RepID=A0A1H1P3P0_9CELL|nr:hypothetical protein [Paraoerskovia marina]SDS05229.1 hypothetical protein SAMN04489860_0683 [Paraoerskovia marina]